MTRSIKDSMGSITNKRTEDQIKKDLLSKQWYECKHKMDGLLLSGNVLKSEATRQVCQQMDQMTTEERLEFIELNFGIQHLKMVEPLVYQLNTIERSYHL